MAIKDADEILGLVEAEKRELRAKYADALLEIAKLRRDELRDDHKGKLQKDSRGNWYFAQKPRKLLPGDTTSKIVDSQIEALNGVIKLIEQMRAGNAHEI